MAFIFFKALFNSLYIEIIRETRKKKENVHKEMRRIETDLYNLSDVHIFYLCSFCFIWTEAWPCHHRSMFPAI